ncbi:MAG: RNA-directed DNA polymerase, partial [Cetobacterium sp.]|uniref:RNA-directed DNA polymerase n=1 Tax=Cetobacterium sp. TaxID=2071632 RepID=UPI003EE56B1C
DKEKNILLSNTEEKALLARSHLSKLAIKEITNKNSMTDKKIIINNIEKNVEFRSKISDSIITWDEIREQLRVTRDGKAASLDLIPCELYKLCRKDKNCKTNLSKIILKFFNICLNDGFIPDEWQENAVVLIFKKGDPQDLDNYRGITLINTLSKIYCKVLAKRLAIINAETNMIRREQTGFIEGEIGLRTVSAVIEIIERRKQRNLETHLCFIDFKKAYDLVPHKLLLEKLKLKKLGDKFIKSIESLYKGTKLKVRIDKEFSEPFSYERGVRQGCPTSPLLFDIFIDDLLDNMDKLEIPLLDEGIAGFCFADDTLLLGSNLDDIQNKINELKKWTTENYMEVNAKKCGIISFNNDESEKKILFDNQEIPKLDKYVYLGVEL